MTSDGMLPGLDVEESKLVRELIRDEAPVPYYYVEAIIAARGQPPSDGMPSEPSEEALVAAIREMNCGWSIPDMAKRALRAAYAAERGVSR